MDLSKIKFSFFRSMRGKLLVWFLILSLVPVFVVGTLAYAQAKSALQQEAISKLEAVRSIKQEHIEDFLVRREGDIISLADTIAALRQDAFDKLSGTLANRKNYLESYFQERRSDMNAIATNSLIVEALMAFDAAGTVKSQKWKEAERQFGPWLAQFAQGYGYDELLLVEPNGRVVYTVKGGADLGENLLSGTLRDSPIAAAFIAGRQNLVFQDIDIYGPGGGLPVAFLAAPVRQHNQLLGVVLVQFPLDGINAIMQERTGLGETGEAYLVGADSRMRSDAYLDPEGRSVAVSFAGTVEQNGVDTRASRRALAGQTEVDIIRNYQGDYVLSAYAPLDALGITWAIIAEMNVTEALIPHAAGHEGDFFEEYAQRRAYSDLLLVNKDGHIIYSIARGAEHATNIITGPYKETNLGRLVQQVIETGQFGLADFAPYAPLNNLPEAFMAAPVMFGDQVEFIVALRLSREQINQVMQERAGLGETGETFLVGADKRMRSNSYLDPVNRSVEASFAGTVEQNGMDTAATRAGLAGETGTKTLVGYTGDAMIAAHAPLEYGGLGWAIIAEQNQVETFAPVERLLWIILAVIGAAVIVIVLLALWITGSLSSPLVKMTEVTRAVTGGNLDVRAEVKSRDETGLLAEAFNQMTDNLRQRMRAEQAASQKAAELAQAERQAKLHLEQTVSEYLAFVEKIGNGDLTTRLSVNGSNDALSVLGRNLNNMVERLADMTRQIREATANIASAAAEILAATTQQAAGANEQSAAISQTSTTIDEVKAIVEQSLTKAQRMAQQALRSRETSDSGQRAVTDTVEMMSQIKEKVEGIAENILALSEQTQQIGEITQTVNEIASQSNLLALNASVEAARAGEHGKGFAVVAVEVRNLAEQSRQATAQVKSILNEIQRATNMAVMATEEGTKGADLGVKQASLAGGTIEQMQLVIGENANAAQQVAASAQQQTTGMEQIALAMDNINQATMQSLASTRQAEKAARNLSALAQQMENLVTRYKLN